MKNKLTKKDKFQDGYTFTATSKKICHCPKCNRELEYDECPEMDDNKKGIPQIIQIGFCEKCRIQVVEKFLYFQSTIETIEEEEEEEESM